uniref:Uncharacterized protein n=1 Tax=Myripristis murdjan TaxID=586833 RepID=A0A667XGT5_9TELE
MAEDHGLGDGDGSVDVAEGVELLLLAVAQHVVLFDRIQRLLLSLQLDDVGVRHDALGKQHLAVFRQHPAWHRGKDSKLGSLNHDVRLIQHKHLDLLGINKLELGAPVQHGAWCANDNLLLQLHAPSLTLVASDGVNQFDFWIVLSHLLDHLASLKRQLIGR